MYGDDGYGFSTAGETPSEVTETGVRLEDWDLTEPDTGTAGYS